MLKFSIQILVFEIETPRNIFSQGQETNIFSQGQETNSQGQQTKRQETKHLEWPRCQTLAAQTPYLQEYSAQVQAA